jgi:diguanylate cyclase (GGDEF)-like protein
VRNEPVIATIPVLLLTAHADTEVDIVRGATLGATDHLSKPFSGAVLRAKVTRAVESCRARRALEGRLETAERLARIDPLTQLGNRQLFYERLREEASFAARHKSPLALVVIDIDHFKSLNDTLGHEAGDRALTHVAGVLSGALRREDGAFRYGGEEFAVLMRGVDAKAALACTTRLRAALSARPLSLPNGGSRDITFSAGVAVADASNDFLADALFARADEALYRAKESGRNRDEVA